MSVLSIQSQVALGYVGNSAAVFALQRLGYEVWALPTLLFSNHPGHGDVGGSALEPELLTDLLAGLARRGIFSRCRAVLSGYLGRASAGAVVREAVRRARAESPAALYVLDPVVGDRETGVFVRDDVLACIRDSLVSIADIVTPNVFELEVLTGIGVRSDPSDLEAADRLRESGPRSVLVTGIEPEPGLIGASLIDDEGAWYVQTEKVETAGRANGAGDFFTACYLARLLASGDPIAALESAVASVHAALLAARAAGLEALDLVRTQDAWLSPAHTSSAIRLR